MSVEDEKADPGRADGDSPSPSDDSVEEQHDESAGDSSPPATDDGAAADSAESTEATD
ncbi:MAG: hypothetical protein JRI68_35575, partial [Deltaproteobacteria bacterium]|nr:hypothetical protein [Deltaproteobacteria bacterium]